MVNNRSLSFHSCDLVKTLGPREDVSTERGQGEVGSARVPCRRSGGDLEGKGVGLRLERGQCDGG